MDKVLVGKIIGAIIRPLMLILGEWLRQKGIADQATLDSWIQPTIEILCGIGAELVAVCWGVIQKVLSHNTVAVTKPDVLGRVTTVSTKITSAQALQVMNK